MALYFKKQPSSITTREGYKAVFSVEVIDDTNYTDTDEVPVITYKWYSSSNGGARFTQLDSTSSSIEINDVHPAYNNTMYKCVASNGTDTVESVVVIMIVISNTEITSNFKMEYTSRFTGEEIDEALYKYLGKEYDTRITPGTRLIGRYSGEDVDLNELDIPGIYTAHFYLHGPKELKDVNGTTPIQIAVFTSEDYEVSGETSLFQSIITIAYASEDNESSGILKGQSLLYLFYRDIADENTPLTDSSQNFGWSKLLLSNGSMTVINNLHSRSKEYVLSANMGRYLKYLIDQDNVGGFNNLSSSGIRKHDDKEEYSEFGFFDVWKQIASETSTETASDSDTNGALIFECSGSAISGKMDNDDGLKAFNPISYFDSYLNDEYLSINTLRTEYNSNDAYHPEGFSSDGRYGYMTKDAADLATVHGDNAYTASVWVKLLEPSPAEVFVQLDMCYIGPSGKHEFLSHLIDKFIISEDDGQTEMIDVEESEQDESSSNKKEIFVTSETSPEVAGKMTCSYADLPEGKWVKLTATINDANLIMARCREGAQAVDATGNISGDPLAPFEVTHVKMSFGVIGNAAVQFKNFKLERGKIATDGAMTLAEMWNEFDNANYLRTVPIDKNVNMADLKEKQGLVFTMKKGNPLNDTTRGRWVNKYLATGGGGGFVVQATPPSETEVLWYVWPSDEDIVSEDESVRNAVEMLNERGYVTSTSSNGTTLKHYKGAFYYYAEDGYGVFDEYGNPVLAGNGWYPAESNYEIGNDPPANIFKFWLDTNNNDKQKYNINESPDLKYYDTNFGKWRIVGSEARPCWIIQDTPPEAPDDDLMWITTSGIASVPYTKQDGTKIWLPIQAIWGKND